MFTMLTLLHVHSIATRRALLVPALFVAIAQTGSAQEAATLTASPKAKWEFLASSGALIATGAERQVLKDAQASSVQVTYVAHPRLAVTSTLGWARSRDLTTVGRPKLDVFSYDVGVETRGPRFAVAKSVQLSPFAGLGGGARSLNHRHLDIDATHHAVGYVSAGGEVGAGRVRVRIEARDYVCRCSAPGVGGTDVATSATRESVARNDVVLMAGLRFVKRGGRSI